MLLALAFLLAGVELEAEAKVRGRTLDVNIRVVNEGAPFTMIFPSMQIYDMELAPGELRWSGDRMFAQVLCERRIPSGAWRMRERWRLPPTIKPGGYKLRVWLTHQGTPLETTVDITIPEPR